MSFGSLNIITCVRVSENDCYLSVNSDVITSDTLKSYCKYKKTLNMPKAYKPRVNMLEENKINMHIKS